MFRLEPQANLTRTQTLTGPLRFTIMVSIGSVVLGLFEKEDDVVKKLLALAMMATWSTVALAAPSQKLSFEVVGAY